MATRTNCLWRIVLSPISTSPLGDLKELKEELVAQTEPPPGLLSHFFSISKATALKLVLLAAISLALMPFSMKYRAVNKDVYFTLDRQQAIEAAKKELERKHVDSNPFKIVASLSDETNTLALQYVFEQLKTKQTLDLAQKSGQGLYWRIRFLQPLNATEYEVWLDQKGAVQAFVLTEPEDAVGAKLSVDQAKNKVESYLNTEHSEWQPYKFENWQVNERKARTDYTFTYTVPSLKVGEAEFKVTVNVLGDVISGFDADWDIPDQWLNERNTTAKDEILLQLRTGFNVFLFVAGIIWAFGLLRSGQIKWKLAYLLALPFMAVSLLQQLNGYPQLYRPYITTLPLYSYIVSLVTNYLQSVQGNFLYFFCGCALAVAALYTVAQGSKLRLIASLIFSRHYQQSLNERRTFWLNSWLIAVAAICLHSLINSVSDTLRAHVSPGCPVESLGTICVLANVAWPSLSIILDALSATLNQLMMVAIFSGLYKRFCSGFTMYAIFIVLMNLITYSATRYWQDYAIDVTTSCIWELSIWFFIVKIIRLNPLAYLFVGVMDSLFSILIDMIEHAWPIYSFPIILAILLLLAPALYVLYLWLIPDSKVQPGAVGK